MTIVRCLKNLRCGSGELPRQRASTEGKVGDQEAGGYTCAPVTFKYVQSVKAVPCTPLQLSFAFFILNSISSLYFVFMPPVVMELESDRGTKVHL
jgi:hypothetical protein